MDGNRPPLEAGGRVLVAFKDLEGDALLAQTLGKTEAAETTADDENVHFPGYGWVELGRVRMGWFTVTRSGRSEIT